MMSLSWLLLPVRPLLLLLKFLLLAIKRLLLLPVLQTLLQLPRAPPVPL